MCTGAYLVSKVLGICVRKERRHKQVNKEKYIRIEVMQKNEHIYINTYVHMYVFMYVCRYIYIDMCLCVCTYIYIWMHIYGRCMLMSMSVYACFYSYAYVYRGHAHMHWSSGSLVSSLRTFRFFHKDQALGDSPGPLSLSLFLSLSLYLSLSSYQSNLNKNVR